MKAAAAVNAALDARELSALPAVGYRFYVAGHHWEVEEQTVRDGEPAVRCRCLSGSNSRVRFNFIWRLTVRRAIESHYAEGSRSSAGRGSNAKGPEGVPSATPATGGRPEYPGGQRPKEVTVSEATATAPAVEEAETVKAETVEVTPDPKGSSKKGRGRSSSAKGKTDAAETTPAAEPEAEVKAESKPAEPKGPSKAQAARDAREALMTDLMGQLPSGLKKVEKPGYIRLFKGDNCVAWVYRKKGGLLVSARIQPEDVPPELKKKTVPGPGGTFGVRLPVENEAAIPAAVTIIETCKAKAGK